MFCAPWVFLIRDRATIQHTDRCYSRGVSAFLDPEDYGGRLMIASGVALDAHKTSKLLM